MSSSNNASADARTSQLSEPPTSTDTKANLPTSTSTTSSLGQPASIEDDVKQLVGSVTSWWAGFSKKSQEQINEVRATIDSQGGLVSMAKREAAKFEAQLNEAQKAARQNVRAAETQADGGAAEAASDVTTSPSSLAKGKTRQLEGDDGADVERLQEAMQRKRQTSSASDEAVSRALSFSPTGDALFDAADTSHEEDSKVLDEAIAATRQNAQTALQSMQSFWGKLQSDPRISNVQASVAQTLQGISLPRTSNEQERAATEDGTTAQQQSPRTKRNLALPDLSKQFQSAFPQMDLSQSQAMAKRYFEASQNAARDWSKEMGSMMSDLVKVVPPSEQTAETATTTATTAAQAPRMAATSSSSAPLNAAATTGAQHTTALQGSIDDDDFDWDREVESASSNGLETTTGPPTTSWEGSDDHTSLVQTVSEAEEQGVKAAVGSASSKAGNTNTTIASGKPVEDEDDSDWE